MYFIAVVSVKPYKIWKELQRDDKIPDQIGKKRTSYARM